MPSWNTVYAPGDGTDFQDKALINMYIAALEERNAWHGAAFPPLVAGDDIQNHLLWRRFQEYFDGGTFFEPNFGGLSAVQVPSDDSFNTAFWVEDIDFTGHVQSDLYPAGSSFDNTASGGRPATRSIDWTFVKAAVLGGKSWTRKHPKEFLNAASTVYNWTNTARDPNAFSNGDYARRLDDSNVYQRVAGAWVPVSGILPDIITTDGPMQAGDYLGYWVLNELRDAINLLVVAVTIQRTGYINPDGRQNAFGGGLAGPYTTWAAAKAGEEAVYNASGVGYYSTPGYQTAGEYDGTDWYAGLTRTRAKVKAGCWNAAIAATVDVYNIGYPNPYSGTFDNSGDPVNNGTWTKWTTIAVPANSAAVDSPYLGSVAVPNWVADPAPTVGVLTTNGYITSNGGGDYGHSSEISLIYRPAFVYHS